MTTQPWDPMTPPTTDPIGAYTPTAAVDPLAGDVPPVLPAGPTITPIDVSQWDMDPTGWGSFSILFGNGYAVTVYDPEQHLKMLGAATTFLTKPDRFEAFITHGDYICDTNPLNKGRFEGEDAQHITNLLQLIQGLPENPACTHGRVAARLATVIGMADGQAEVCPRCQGAGEISDQGRMRSCNCLEGRLG